MQDLLQTMPQLQHLSSLLSLKKSILRITEQQNCSYE